MLAAVDARKDSGFIWLLKTITGGFIYIMSVYKKQIGGSHYKDMKIQPSEFITKNKLLFAEGNAIKYICRHAI